MGKSLTARLGLPGPGLLGDSPSGDMWIDRKLSARDRQRLLAAAVAAYKAHPQVEAVFTGQEIAAISIPTGAPETWSTIQRVRASYFQGRSGDLFVVLKRDITPIADTSRFVATHGSVWDYDRRVPMLFWRKGSPGSTIEHSAETTDIMPTLASMIGLALAPGSIDGHCLKEVAGAVCQ
jgi:predicted AlkP superfamily pyrophosphatase or phosphodiesterase